MHVTYIRALGQTERTLIIRQPLRKQADVWFGPLWLAEVVAQQLILDGCVAASVREGIGNAGQVRSRLLEAVVPDAPVVSFREASRLGRRRAVKV